MLSNFNQPLRFDAFMQQALYHPEFGYYARGEAIFGRQGDFITAPELSPLFGRTLAKAITEVLPLCNRTVYEFGAGTGRLACDILTGAGESIEHYCIVDLSGGLKAIQQHNLASQLPPKLASKVSWLTELPASLNGVVIGNEVLDATPVRRFKWTTGQVDEAWVKQENGQLCLHWQPAEAAFSDQVKRLEQAHGPWPSGYESEIAQQAAGLMRTLTDRLQGLALMIDYGHHEALYYSPSRTQGTLRATSGHVAHDDFLSNPGQQDLTAHVNFSAMYEALTECGGALEGYCHQGEFLLANGILDMARETPLFTDPVAGAALRQRLNMLVSEADMGLTFKVLAWSKGINIDDTALHHVFLRHDRSAEL